ncbi:MAG: hypothetical protein HFG49_08430 [Lachnospiraceae bacterium]|jgi:transposase|nr:hypothetical protein [Lachnospiraceae bacterium]
MKVAMKKPTRNQIDILVEKGMTIKQIALLYQCSESYIARTKSRKGVNWVQEANYKNPIRPEEIRQAKQVPVGEMVRICNHWKRNADDALSYGVWEEHRIVRKLPHIVILDNGMSVDYVEIAMQMRERI